jgi:hypothetical protein
MCRRRRCLVGEVLDMVRSGKGDFLVAVEDLEDEVERLRKQVAEKPVVYVNASGGVTQYTGVERGGAVILNIDWDETDVSETNDAHASIEYIEARLGEFEPYADLPNIAEAIRMLREALDEAVSELPEDEREGYE